MTMVLCIQTVQLILFMTTIKVFLEHFSQTFLAQIIVMNHGVYFLRHHERKIIVPLRCHCFIKCNVEVTYIMDITSVK